MAMYKAIDSGNVDEMLRLLDADPMLLEDVIKSGGSLEEWMTPLIRAAYAGQLEMVKLILARGAKIQAKSLVGQTALHFAAENGHEEVVVYLLNNGADSIHQDTSGYTPLMYASDRNHLGVVLRLLEHMGGQGLEAMSRCGHASTALEMAVFKGHAEVLAHLLRHGADGLWRMALRDAVTGGHVGVLQVLVDHLGTQALRQREVLGGTLLHTALKLSSSRYLRSRESCAGIVAYLLSKGLSPTTRDAQGVTPLMYSAGNTSVGVLLRLLEYMGGPGVDMRDDEGRTALHFAVNARKPAHVRALLLAGADPTIVDNRGRTSHAVAEEKGFLECTAAFKWWEGELECGALLVRARALRDAHAAHQQAPTCPAPNYLKARVSARLAVPSVEVVAGQGEGAGWDWDCSGQQERHAMVGLVVEELSEALFTELMQGFRPPRNSGVEAPVGKELEVPTGEGAPGGQGAADARDIKDYVFIGLYVGGCMGAFLGMLVETGVRASKGEELGRWLGGGVGAGQETVVGALVGGGMGALVGALFGTDMGGDVGAGREPLFPTIAGWLGVVASVLTGAVLLVAAILVAVVLKVSVVVAAGLIGLLTDALFAVSKT